MKKMLPFLLSVLAIGLLVGCNMHPADQAESASGVKKATVQISTNANGLTAEQQNISDRLLEDNKPGSVKHLYVISAYSGQVIIYSTVRGKVTSGGKRLTPTSVTGSGEWHGDHFDISIGNQTHRTAEVLQDDGTYGSSSEYLYWWDTKGFYHQHYVSGGQILHISNQPLAVKSIIINMEIIQKPEE